MKQYLTYLTKVTVKIFKGYRRLHSCQQYLAFNIKTQL